MELAANVASSGEEEGEGEEAHNEITQRIVIEDQDALVGGTGSYTN